MELVAPNDGCCVGQPQMPELINNGKPQCTQQSALVFPHKCIVTAKLL